MPCVLSASSQDRARSYTETSKTSADTETSFAIKSVESTCSSRGKNIRIKSGNIGHWVNSDIHLQTVKFQMRRLLMSRLIRISTVCLVNYVLFNNLNMKETLGRCPNLVGCPNLPDFT